MMMRIPTRPIAASFLALLLTTCSTLPARGQRPEVEFRVAATYRFEDCTPTAVQVPASSSDLMIIELSTEPGGLQESFENGRRFLLLPDNCHLLRLRCHYRIYGYQENSPDLPNPAQLFPGATSLAIL